MEYRCHQCGQLNIGPDPQQPGPVRCYCEHCGASNIIDMFQEDDRTQMTVNNNENNGYMRQEYPPTTGGFPPQGGYSQGGYPPPGGGQQSYPEPPQKNNSWIIPVVSVVVAAIIGLAVWYFVSNRTSGDLKGQELEEYQEDLVRDFYRDCVFGNPTIKDLKKALTPKMLADIRESTNEYALYKFLTGKNQGTGKESRLLSVVALGDDVVSATYLDNGVKGTSLVYLIKDDKEWKINDVDFQVDKSDSPKKADSKKVVVNSDTYSYEGTIDDEYPITCTLTFTPDGSVYKVTGKYAYYSTLNKNGDKKSSWIRVNGTTDKYNNIRWVESIPGNSSYDSKFNGQISGNFSVIKGNLGSTGEHYLYLSR